MTEQREGDVSNLSFMSLLALGPTIFFLVRMAHLRSKLMYQIGCMIHLFGSFDLKGNLRVMLIEFYSTQRSVASGAMQGVCSGELLLFKNFITDWVIECTLISFADDTKLG